MEITTEALGIFVLLMPGFVASIVLNSLVVRQKHDAFQRLIEALVFSFIIYAITSWWIPYTPPALIETTVGSRTIHSIESSSSSLAASLGAAAFLALFLAWIITHDFHMRLLRCLSITRKTSRDTAWIDIFSDQGKRWVVVTLSDGRRVRGWPQYYSDTPAEGLLYLHHPAWITKEGGAIPMKNTHGLFLVRKGFIKSITFLQNTQEMKEESNGRTEGARAETGTGAETGTEAETGH